MVFCASVTLKRDLVVFTAEEYCRLLCFGGETQKSPGETGKVNCSSECDKHVCLFVLQRVKVQDSGDKPELDKLSWKIVEVFPCADSTQLRGFHAQASN